MMNKNNYKAFYTLLYIVTVSLLMVAIDVHAHDLRFNVTRLSTKDGLSCNTINSVQQDRDGFIWLSTPDGMSRYDGYQFQNFSKFNNNIKERNYSSIAQLISDNTNGQIWGYTPNNILCCYDLEAARFSDYFDLDASTTLLSNRFQSSKGTWISSADFGVRFICVKEGKMQSIDFTPQNGKLLDTHKLNIQEDDKNNIWIASEKGVNLITPDFKSRVILKNKKILVMTCEGSRIAVLTDQGEAFLYNDQTQLIKHSQLPSMLGFVGKSRASFFWQGWWYIFTQGETFAMDLKTGQFHKPALQIPNAMDKNQLKSYHFLYDKQGNAYLFDKKSALFKKFHLLDNPTYINARDKNFVAAESQDKKVYITSYGSGFFVYDPKTDILQQFSVQNDNSLFHTDFLLNVFVDRSDCVWVGTGDGVFCCVEQKELNSEFIKMEPESKHEWSNTIRHISKVAPHKLAVSTRENKTYLFDTQTRQRTLMLQTDACVYCYGIDARGRVWIGTKGDGILIDGIKYSKREKEHYAPTINFYDVAFDKLGRAWLATWGDGLLCTRANDANTENLKFESFMATNGKEAQIHDLFLDKKGRLWASTNNGIAMIDTHDSHITDKKILKFNEENEKLPVSEVDCGLEAHDGSLWFGTTKGVMRCTYDEKTKKLDCQLFNTTNGLTTNTVRSVAEDRYGNIWIGTEEGISKINSHTLDIRTYQLRKDILSNNFTENCAVSLEDGRIAFGTSNALLLLTPTQKTKEYPHGTKATITNMTINGISIYEAENEDLLTKALNHTREISLPSDKNSLSIFFSNFDYPHIKNAMYQYYLEGLDKTWCPMTSVNHADFSSLPPGTYTLHLRTFIGNNKWSEETLFKITIREPWYNTWWAWTIYLVIIGSISFLFYRSWLRNFNLNQQIEMEKQMSNFRIEFFTHISHEFRTPLAIIQSAVAKLNNKEGSSRNALLTLTRSTRRMQRLINQLMEFRKANTGNMKLTMEEGDIVVFIKNIFSDVRQVAQQKGINMSMTPSSSNYRMFFDHNKVETIVYNLLSNAVKYTPDNGTIEVKLTLKDEELIFQIEDNGPGIKPEREKDLFKPFMHGYVSKGGMGIGLYTAYEMAKLHKGDLSYKRSGNLGGSIFTLTLPTDKNLFEPEDFVTTKAIDNSSVDKEEIDMMVKEMTPQAINNVTVVVIEDDPDMMEQIKSELSTYFRVEAFMNGKTGYENIRRIKPALVISDIMLPGMSGYEIVSNLKADPETQDIPVIMLTAFDDANHILKAYKSFVDDYMVKPCNFKLLVARALQFVAADMKQKKSAHEKKIAAETGKEVTTEAEKEPTTEKAEKEMTTEKTIKIKPVKELKKNEPTLYMSALDKKFKDTLEAIVAQHISDNSFNVDKLAELLNLGRTTVYNRTKSIMGVSPNIYIQNERLRIAAKLLLEGEYSVAEISEKVGFSDSTYFYKCFKNKYGVAPSKYGK